MTTSINIKGALEVDICDLLKNISPESKQDLIYHLSCDEEIIKNAADQIIDGYFLDKESYNWNGAEASTKEATPSTSLDRARRRIAENQSEIAAKEIEGLKEALEKAKKEYWELWNSRHPRSNY